MSSILSSLETCPPSFAIVAKCQRKISRLELRVELIAAVVLVLIVALLFSLLPLLFSSSFLLPFFFSREKSEKVTAEFLFVLNLKSNGKFKFEIGRREASRGLFISFREG